jgi:hypothetical protein
MRNQKILILGDSAAGLHIAQQMKSRGIDTSNVLIDIETDTKTSHIIPYDSMPNVTDYVHSDEPEIDCLKLAKNKIKFASKPHKRKK